jgi:hypothetical protein
MIPNRNTPNPNRLSHKASIQNYRVDGANFSHARHVGRTIKFVANTSPPQKKLHCHPDSIQDGPFLTHLHVISSTTIHYAHASTKAPSMTSASAPSEALLDAPTYPPSPIPSSADTSSFFGSFFVDVLSNHRAGLLPNRPIAPPLYKNQSLQIYLLTNLFDGVEVFDSFFR